MPTADRLGSLYRLDVDGSVRTVVSDVDIANGMGLSPDERTFYFTESNRLPGSKGLLRDLRWSGVRGPLRGDRPRRRIPFD